MGTTSSSVALRNKKTIGSETRKQKRCWRLVLFRLPLHSVRSKNRKRVLGFSKNISKFELRNKMKFRNKPIKSRIALNLSDVRHDWLSVRNNTSDNIHQKINWVRNKYIRNKLVWFWLAQGLILLLIGLFSYFVLWILFSYFVRCSLFVCGWIERGGRAKDRSAQGKARTPRNGCRKRRETWNTEVGKRGEWWRRCGRAGFEDKEEEVAVVMERMHDSLADTQSG